jgi:hypothetical protein
MDIKGQYHGFNILQDGKPVSLNMWQLQIASNDLELCKKLDRYRKQNGTFATSAGPLDHALQGAHEYIDAVLAEP